MTTKKRIFEANGALMAEIRRLRSELAEAREALASLMEDIEMWGVDEFQFESCHKARAALAKLEEDPRA